MTQILFSHSYFYRYDKKQWDTQNPFPPLGTIYAASFLKNEGYKVDLLDSNLAKGPEHVFGYLRESNPKYFILYDDGFNYLTKMCLTNMREAAFEMIAEAKRNNSIVIVNSSDSTDHYSEYLEQGADFIIYGEGEITLSELLGNLEGKSEKELHEINGLYFKQDDGSISKTSVRTVERNLDVFPMPAWDLIAIEAYREIWNRSGKEFTLNIATTRGCPYKCNWCAKPIYGNRYNSHSPNFITKEIDYLVKNFGVNRFWMCDDIFGLKPQWVQEFNSSLKEANLSIRYYIQSRADLLLESDNIKVLAESGLDEVWIGAESGSQRILDAMDKGTKISQIYEATRLLKSLKIKVAFFIQFGYSGENKMDILKTIQMIKDLNPDNIGISVSYPLPGTKFYEQVKMDMANKSNWSESDDLAMMFKSSFNTDFYRILHGYVHKEYHKSKGWHALQKLKNNPFTIRKNGLKAIVKAVLLIPMAWKDRMKLNKMENVRI